MSNEEDFELSDELQRFILLAIGLGLDNMKKSGSLIPMVLSAQGDEYGLAAITVEADEVMEAAAEHVAGLPPETDRYALVFDGKMNVEGEIVSAVIAQGGERGAAHGHMVYQSYNSGTHEPEGIPDYAGQVEQLLR